ncbi:hypothetical protein M0208_12500 [Sphingomonas sp. SUN019]|uniref:hypothetical protein n=1 Tax=Sphingomonas sp. SUN019 TaxID=2937788 RepID=UPI002164961F|nr:hypothetical protein [Sphingomonas sp. SUN019]UVO51290.1 hypothetical protein M0208_12500 [Sphingomonas sp. SUN019]
MDTQHPPLRQRQRRHAAVAFFITSSFAALLPSSAQAAGVRAGSLIANTATATYDDGATTATVSSNTVTLKVDEIVDVAVASRDSADLRVAAGSSGNVRSFTVSNPGNGMEAYVLTADGHVDGTAFDATITGLAIDTNGNGVYEEGVDAPFVAGSATAAIAPDASITVFVLSSIPAGASDAQRGAVLLRAVAETGSGPAGTVFAGQGADGGDALIGATTADARATGGLIVSRASVRFEKAAVVLDPFGGTRVVPGSIVTYRLSATVDGSGTAPGLRIADTIPDGTSYVAGSLSLDGRSLTDAADSDEGAGSATRIDVVLGDVAAGAARVTAFKVKIN